MGQLKQSLVRNILLQRSNCNILGHTDTVALFAKEARFYQISGVLTDMFSPKLSR